MGQEAIAVQTDQPVLKQQQKTAGGGPDRLKKFQYPKGVSGNPKGRPKKGLPITDRTRWMQDQQAPMVVRMNLEKALRYEKEETVEEEGEFTAVVEVDGKKETHIIVGKVTRIVKTWVNVELPEKLTYADAMVMMRQLAALGVGVGNYRVDIDREIREIVEGKVANRVEITDLTDVPVEDIDSVKRILYGHYAEVAIERAQMFNMPMPGFQALADEAGIGDQLGIPREEDVKQT